MPVRRGLIEILYAMVKICVQENGILKTHMMYKTNQNSRQLKNHIELLEKIGWIEESEKKKNFYVPTDKGKRAVEGYDIFLQQIPKELLHLVLSPSTVSKFYYSRSEK